MKDAIFIFVGQLLSLALFAVFLPELYTQDWIFISLLYFVGACLGGTVTYHRLLSHRSWNAPKWWWYVGSLCGMFFLVGSPLAWSNNHIAHHRFTDTERDPHSPSVLGFFKVQFCSMFYTVKTLKYGLRNINPFQLFLHKHYLMLHASWIAFLSLTLGLKWLVVLYCAPSVLVWHGASLVNTWNHTKSLLNYKPHDCGDSSQNNLVTGWLVFGEGWHNTHHAHPTNARFGRKWYELDLGWLVIKLLESKHAQK